MKWHGERPDRLRDRVMPEAHVGMLQCNVTLSNAAFPSHRQNMKTNDKIK